MKNLKIILLIIAVTALVSCSRLKEIVQQSNSAEMKRAVIVNVPRNLKSATVDSGINKESSLVVALTNDTEIFLNADVQPVEKYELGAKIRDFAGRTPKNEKFIYIKAGSAIDYKTLVMILDEIRKNDVDAVKLVVSQSEESKADSVLEAKIQPEPKESDPVKPDPLTLVAAMQKDGKIKLNQEDNTIESLKSRLREVFRNREENGVFREGTNEVYKSVIVKCFRSAKYEDVARLINALNEAGASPIILQIDDLSE